MVTKEEVEQLMLRYFPSCPLCGANTGYEVSGLFKHVVQCRSCGAKWARPLGGKRGTLDSLTLLQPSHDGRGRSLKRKTYPVKFWQDSDGLERLIEEKKRRKGPEEEKRAREIEDLFRKLKTKDTKVRSEARHRLKEIGQLVFR